MMIIAEAGVNHDGKLDRALKLVDIAKMAGADAVKFQMFDAQACHGPSRDILVPLELSRKEFKAIRAYCEKNGIGFLASAFDRNAVDFLVDIGVDVVKIASGEIVNLPLIAHVAKRGAKLLLSTGMSTLPEVSTAVNEYLLCGGKTFDLLHCVSLYPTPLHLCNLRAITTLRNEFHCTVGFSDHTTSNHAAAAAIALGAVILEKHFTDNPRASGPDHAMSLSPLALASYVKNARIMERALGTGEKIPQAGEDEMRTQTRGRWT